MRRLIRRLNEDEGRSFMISSHLLHEVELISNRIGILEKGKMVYEGPPADFGRLGNPVFLLKASPLDQAAQILRDLGAEDVAVDEAETDKIKFTVAATVLPAVHHALQTKDIAVHTLAERRMTLEDFFVQRSQEMKEGRLS